ncbi:MAG TPA: PqqD family protein [Trichormus sp.]|jgi:hypothetical protein
MYVKPANVLCRSVDNDTLLLNVTNGHYYSLDLIGGRIWTLMLEGLDADAIAARLHEEHAAEKQEILSAVQELIADLVQEGLTELEPQFQPV